MKVVQRKKKKPTSLLILAELREKMSLKKAYTADALAEMCGKKVPAMRRYLRVLEGLSFLIVQKRGKIKYYATPEAVSQSQKKQ